MATVALKGSDRTLLPGIRVLGDADPGERLEVSVLVRRRDRPGLQSRIAALVRGDSAIAHLSREQFERQHGADAADLAAVRDYASSQGISTVQQHAGRRTVVLSGTVEQFSRAFSVHLQLCAHGAGTYRGRSGTIQLPAALDGIVEAVLGLDNRPQAQTHFRLRRPLSGSRKRPASAAAMSYTPIQIANLYGFPAATGANQCVGIIELGGGYRPDDLQSYFNTLGVAAPTVVAVSVDQGKNAPTGDANGPDGEVMLDIEVVGAVAPQARIAVYFAPNTDAGFLDAVTSAIHDTTHRPSVLSISWGSAESSWTQQAMTAMDEAFQAAAAIGVTICVASGDSGSSDGVSDGSDHADFPASSPHAIGCGGTSLHASGNRISSEVVWNDGASGGASGGGISSVFATPTWQTGLSVVRSGGTKAALNMRGVPDVSGCADPETGYQVRIDGTDTVIGGTSAVAPLWAALIARVNQLNGVAVGFLNAKLYQQPTALRDITQGNNGDFEAASGWDACTGLGSPNSAASVSLVSPRRA
ncbi:MAG TPA: S53 family peptidase [Steroidobacteraceae bacterium]|jgi:kumamolisin